MSILVVLTDPAQAGAQVHWGYQFARARRESLVVLYAAVADEESAAVEYPREPAEGEPSNAVLVAMRAAADKAEAVAGTIDEGHPNPPDIKPPLIVLKTLQGPRPHWSTEREMEAVQASLVVVERNWKADADVTLESQLFDHATVDIVVLRCGGHDEGAEYTARRIVAPAGEGGHVIPALALGAQLAERNCGTLTALYIEEPDYLQAAAVGQRVLERNLRRADVSLGPHVETRVRLDADVERGIGAFVAERKPDLVLIGADDKRFIKRMLFSTLPDSLFTGEDAVTLAIMRRAQPSHVRVIRVLERWFFLRIPQMARTDRIALYDRLQNGSEWDFDFAALIGLSTSIAALGLIQSSAAVVIGAMLVAPLMTPILGAGLALVSGNSVLVRSSVKAIALGFLLAVSIGLVVGLISPVRTLTPELLSRGGPNLLDMGVAFVSGIAAAFAMSRPNLLAALPGVAIAAALVPPIATVGIALAWGEFDIAIGSAMLFGTNVVAIIVGASVVMFAVGVRRTTRKDSWRPWMWATLLVAMIALAVPLASYLWTAARQSARTTVPDTLRADIRTALSGDDTPTYVDVQRAPDVRYPDGTLLTVYVHGRGTSPALGERLGAIARPYSQGRLQVRLVPVFEVEARTSLP